MNWIRNNSDILLRLDPGDEIHSSIQLASKELGINSAAITSGIGRICNTDIGYLGADSIYQHNLIKENVELLSLQGNLAILDGEPFTHIHIVCNSDDHVVHGGHLFSAVVAVTAEIHLREFPGITIERCNLPNSEFKSLELRGRD